MKQVRIIAIDVNVTSRSLAVQDILQMVYEHHGAYVCVANVHMCMEAFDSDTYRSIVNNANYVLPDGKPLSVAQKLLTLEKAEQVRGQDIMNALCSISGKKNLKIGFYGGSSSDVLNSVMERLQMDFPDIKICFDYSPPFRPLTEAEDQVVTRQINQAQIDILFVGIGCPKQEIWMAEHRDSLSCVMLGVGAAFDFIAGNKKHAPRWVQRVGLEWLFRLLSEPRRLWKRYLKQNPRFVWYFIGQWLFKQSY